MGGEVGHIPSIDASIQIKKGGFNKYYLTEINKVDTIYWGLVFSFQFLIILITGNNRACKNIDTTLQVSISTYK